MAKQIRNHALAVLYFFLGGIVWFLLSRREIEFSADFVTWKGDQLSSRDGIEIWGLIVTALFLAVVWEVAYWIIAGFINRVFARRRGGAA